MMLLEQAKARELSKFPARGEEVRGKFRSSNFCQITAHVFHFLTYTKTILLTDKMHPRRCSVFPNHPWDADANRKEGVALWIPHTIDGLIRAAQEKLSLSSSCQRLFGEDGARVHDVDMVHDGQKLYLVGGDGEGQSK
jgi:hyperpolarization activated cyclic nucleotide-gated potassium channel 4